MPGVRLHRAAAASPTYPKIRIHKAGASGVVTAPAIRIHKASATGTQATQVTAPASQAGAEPGTMLSVTATATPSGTTIWAWRQISGPTAQLFGSAGTVQITTPFSLATATMTFGVRATVDGVQSTEQTFTIEVLGWAGPWIYQGGSSWAGIRPKVLA